MTPTELIQKGYDWLAQGERYWTRGVYGRTLPSGQIQRCMLGAMGCNIWIDEDDVINKTVALVRVAHAIDGEWPKHGEDAHDICQKFNDESGYEDVLLVLKRALDA